MALEITNLAASTLDGAINDSVTSINVVDASDFPSGGDFWINIENEIIKVTGVSSNTFTVVRGESGGGATAAASHSSGVAVTYVLGSQSFAQLRADANRQGTYSDLSSVTGMVAGDVFRFAGPDPGTLYTHAVYSGSAWELYYYSYGPCEQMDITGYAWTAGTNSAATQSDGSVLFTSVSEPSGANWYNRVYYKAAPAAPYTVRVLIVGYPKGTAALTSARATLSLHDTGSGKIASLEAGIVPGAPLVNTPYFSGALTSTYVGTYGISYTGAHNNHALLEIEDNNTNRIYRYSADFGNTWTDLATTTRTNYLTPTSIGPGFGNRDGYSLSWWVLSYEVS